MAQKTKTLTTAQLLKKKQEEVLDNWVTKNIESKETRVLELMTEKEFRKQTRELLKTFTDAFAAENYEDITQPEFTDSVTMLKEISASRAKQGFSPSETATLVFSLKDALLGFMMSEFAGDLELLNSETIKMNRLIDKLGLVTFEAYSLTKTELIAQQAKEIMDSTPIISVLDDVLALPIIGTLDSERTMQIMENLLTKIVEYEARVVIVDITGVSTVDTLTATHLLKTANAVRLLGARIIITGISPIVAQTLVELGVDLSELETKSQMVDGITTALQYLNKKVIDIE